MELYSIMLRHHSISDDAQTTKRLWLLARGFRIAYSPDGYQAVSDCIILLTFWFTPMSCHKYYVVPFAIMRLDIQPGIGLGSSQGYGTSASVTAVYT